MGWRQDEIRAPAKMTLITTIQEAAPAVHWRAGWTLILAGFLSGAALGLRFHRDDFAGGYPSLRRRLMRLGHIALIALGMINLLYALSPFEGPAGDWGVVASLGLLAGAALMPTVCFLTAGRTGFRQLFFLPVLCLAGAAGLIAGAAA